MADEIGISSRAVEKNLASLKKNGIINRIGPNRGGYWKIMMDQEVQ
jgi:ATP-dependent DNA helicase RecG